MVLELVGGGDLFTAPRQNTSVRSCGSRGVMRAFSSKVLTSRSPSRFLDREAAYIGSQLVQGLAFLHSQGGATAFQCWTLF